MANQQDKEFVLLSGLPRTGSTLLVSLLMQNPRIYGEGASGLCQIMWDVQSSCDKCDSLPANYRMHTKADIMSALPGLYYKDVKQPIIIEKGRTWTHPTNLNMWKRYVNENQKVIVLIRPIEDIVKSIVALRIKNNWAGNLYADLLIPGSEPICRAAEAIACSRFAPSENFLYVDYRDLISEPLEVLDLIYRFLGWDAYQHDITNIQQKNHENDLVHGLIGMHDIRPQISERQFNIDLPQSVKEACERVNQLVYGQKISGEWSFRSTVETV
jgi:sulfotransferase